MNAFLTAASYIFHPLWMPFAGALTYFLTTPRFFPEPVVKAKLMAIAIMTLFIPIVFHFLLKTLGIVSSPFLREIRERNWPLLFYMLLLTVTLHFVLNRYDYPELYYFFLGILFSTATAWVLVCTKLKVSLHMMGIAGTTMFIVALSIFYNLDLIYTISFLLAATGLTATSRLHLKAHSPLELALGYFIGLIPQIFVLRFWL
jgi:membrane-associated HD superfamily phosphohydrolase